MKTHPANVALLFLVIATWSTVATAQESAQRTSRNAAEARRPVLQILNGSDQTIDVYWLKSDDERVLNATVQPGSDTLITTTLGHSFVIVGQKDHSETVVTSVVPVQALRFAPPDKDGVPAFYTQRISAHGFPIVASAKVNPYALKEAAYLVDLMLAKRPDIRQAMIQSGSRLCILAHNEYTTDQPEFVRLGERPMRQFPGISGKDYWDARARGLGGSERDPLCSCAEENLLAYPGDPYSAECILIHELAHNIHLRGVVNVDPTFDARLKATYDAAMSAGLWKGKYASVNHHEYFAEGVQSWFDNNRENDHDHNHVNTREELIDYDPRLAELCREVFGDTELRYSKPGTRLHGHLAGYDPETAPTFEWPQRLREAKQHIRLAAEQRNKSAENAGPKPEASADWNALRQDVLALGELTAAPEIHDATDAAHDEDGLRAIYFDALPWQDHPTRVFAWLGLPRSEQGAPSERKVPGVVLVHGGGGTAFKEWVKKWNDHGFAAISIAVEGQTDQRDGTGKSWQRHEWAGPARNGIYGDSEQPLKSQWMYHAVADTILANSLLRSLPEVDADKVGVMGISWGGIITSTVMGIDDRFAFAIPTYGCGDLADADNQYGRALGENRLYREVWDPMVRMKHVRMPALWLSWTGDQHFPLDSQRNCYLNATGPHMVALLPKMGHSHPAGWNPPDSYAFAMSIVSTGEAWCQQQEVSLDGEQARVSFFSARPVSRATLVTTSEQGFTGHRAWTEVPVDFLQNDQQVTVSVTLPAGTTAWFVNLHSDDLVASSDFQEATPR